MRTHASLLGIALGFVAALALATPALAGGQDSGNGTPITLTVSNASTPGEYTFTVSKFNGKAKSVGFYIAGAKDVNKDGTLIGFCAPADSNGTTVTNDVLTCTFTPSTSLSNGTFKIEAAEYNKSNDGKGNYVEDNEVKEESNAVTLNNGVPENNLPEAPYAVLLPAAALGVLLVSRRLRMRRA